MSHLDDLKDWVRSDQERAVFLEEVRLRLPAHHVERITRLLECLIWLLSLLQKKDLSIAKLRQLCFGATTESARNVSGKGPKDPKTPQAKGHGRNSHGQYTGARRVRVAHPTLRPGDRCPGCTKGKVRPKKEPAVAITGNRNDQPRCTCATGWIGTIPKGT